MGLKITLKVLLAERDMTMYELAKLDSELEYPTVHSIANNRFKNIPVKGLERICKVLNCQPGDFIKYIDDEPKE